jgi:DNA-binding transcriptional MerR regulator/effector-binding domain-containing protein
MHNEPDRLISIGRFAHATGLTVKALRHYDDAGLLPPARVDPETGYRFYEPAQLRAGAAISRLRALDVPLADIPSILEMDEVELRRRLTAHRAELEGRQQENARAIEDLDRLINGEEPLVPETPPLELEVTEVPARTYIAVRRRAPMELLTQVIPSLIRQTGGWVFAHGGPAGAPMAMVGEPDQAGDMALEVGWRVTGAQDPAEPFEVITYPAGPAIVHRHVGRMERLHHTYAALEQAIVVRGLHPTAPARESYETNPEEEPDPSRWVTEIVWPL